LNDGAPPARFFLYGFYGHGNLGDDLLLRAVVEGIRRLRPGAGFIVRNQGPVTALDSLGPEIELTGIDRLMADRSHGKLSRVLATLRAYGRYFRRCDWLVFGGGTVFHQRPTAAPLLLLLLVCLLARLSGLRIAALGVGVADLRSGTARLLLRCIVFLTDLFAVRDVAALNECRKAGAGGRVRLAGDLVYGLAPALRVAPTGNPSRSTPVLALSLYPPALPEDQAGDQLLAILSQAVAILLERGWQVILLTFQAGSSTGGVGDEAVIARLSAGLAPTQRTQVTRRSLTAGGAEIAEFFAGIDLHCGMRFHGHVLASLSGLPFVGLSHDNKIDEICRVFAMPCLALDRLSAADLVAAVETARSRKPDSGVLETCIRQAAMNFEHFAAVMAG